MQITIIPTQFEVDGQSFSTRELAQEYIDSNADRIRLAAFVANLKAGGAQRVSKAVTDAIAAFIEFEKVKDVPNVEGGGDSPGTTGETSPGMDSGTSEEPGKPEGAGSAGTPESSPDQQSSQSETEQSEESEKSSGSAHVDGPDEDEDTDPLAGLDLGDE
jgi:hypothetical protein